MVATHDNRPSNFHTSIKFTRRDQWIFVTTLRARMKFLLTVLFALGTQLLSVATLSATAQATHSFGSTFGASDLFALLHPEVAKFATRTLVAWSGSLTIGPSIHQFCFVNRHFTA
jgi:hypothetical protein